jgi:NagD protein
MIGDRMDTDVLAGLETGLETILVLSGVTKEQDVKRYPYQPSKICKSIKDVWP